ncbi:hypothetical protein HBI56_037130 [Parastagonospora nodorum]|uniref:Uncharacterized protein n=1 Tax=Phaeosphaeria nodorum (strain SN15 / ATCC MYA-4574 / FGSC 10173) TaxID=321614 RepID=A0A7U2EYY2_PHANO|nr:hypothetical protein HBH56_069680 [Parastagonospora nodorum]QRC93605.1 hypothetical protein JI435_038110 [Parastagonospora nodorum SN15]KAH3932333.1 hypothetical protein HBH54_078450 [Parastagonospora nodorum]KAH3955097.1 hypothetical protein HBH53_015920 [Parastagonospora nodorum]KAH3986170.1 hypothetical protein HBH52_047080 [Parastagonospora nodorum]
MPASQRPSTSKANSSAYNNDDASTPTRWKSPIVIDADANTLPGGTQRQDVNDKKLKDPKPIKDDLSDVSAGTAREEVDTRDAMKKDKDFKDDDTKTLVAGKGRRDRNGKIMTKKELAAEGLIRVLVACTVM